MAADNDRGDLDIANTTQRLDVETFTQEARLAGAGGALDWLLGFYFFSEDVANNRATLFGEDVGDFFAKLTRKPLAALFPPGGGAVQNGVSQNTDSWAFFTHDTLSLTDRLSLTGGIRYTHESKDGAGRFITNSPGCAVGINVLCPVPDFDISRSENKVTGTAKISFGWTPDVLSYVGYSRGYKAGGINLDRSAGLTQFEFKAETVDSVEGGIKSSFADGRVTLNLAAYYSDFSNLQLNTFTGTGFIISNEASVKSKGVEFETRLRPLRGLFLSGAVSFNDAQFSKNNSKANLAGKQLTNAPKWTLNGTLGYSRPVAGASLRGFTRINIRYTSKLNTGSDLAPQKAQKSYAQVNARLGIRAMDNGWELAAWANNLFDRHYNQIIFATPIQRGGFNTFIGLPRTYAMSLRAAFQTT